MVKLFIDPEYTVHVPIREPGNAGIDFYIPELSDTFAKAFNEKNQNTAATLIIPMSTTVKPYIIIAAHGDVNIPTGIRSRLPANVALEANNKSGIAMKKKLIYGASVVDANYKGIIHAHMINTSDKDVTVDLGTKIVQFIPRIIDNDPIVIDETGDFNSFYKDFEFDNRGEGAFGSTGIK